ncbi:hypothetical protein YC2023_092230 [Brassica napus]
MREHKSVFIYCEILPDLSLAVKGARERLLQLFFFILLAEEEEKSEHAYKRIFNQTAEYFRIDHMLNNRSIRKKMVDLLSQDHPKPVNKPKTILNQHESIPDSARKEVFRNKRLNETEHKEKESLKRLEYQVSKRVLEKQTQT